MGLSERGSNMESLTKNKQSEETISKMVEKYYAPLQMKSYQELTEGYFVWLMKSVWIMIKK